MHFNYRTNKNSLLYPSRSDDSFSCKDQSYDFKFSSKIAPPHAENCHTTSFSFVIPSNWLHDSSMLNAFIFITITNIFHGVDLNNNRFAERVRIEKRELFIIY